MKIENDYAEFHIKDGLLYFRYKPVDSIDLEAAKIIVRDRLAVQKGKSYPVVCYLDAVKNVEKDARDYLAVEGSQLVKAVAIIIASTAKIIMTNFYLSVNKPLVPTKMFSNETDAKKYLEPYMH